MNKVEVADYSIASYFNELRTLVEGYTGEDIIIKGRSNGAAYAKFLFVLIAINPPDPFIKASYKEISEFLILGESNIRQYILYYTPKLHYLKDFRVLKRRLFAVISKRVPANILNNILSTNTITIESLIDNVIDTKQLDRVGVQKFADYLKNYCLTRYIDE